ncbi:hypothetical protein [Thermaerobacillus caldiproteolyticus]|uniref:Copper amine oxidase-like N-terminal domain-containing protein n=1 Tax=Thermaerobacillus caldiproteolyticus TaxID=247480 RepID=A0A7W0BZ42_9BACL|nr:hypothetical protein [Anoxybacillus caldiproteolyticus]MBA2874106.1 hypothetical protein [Anoxybacillus caldiproteolyticus]QPA31941.1 hypothetical protein ISX45_02775 [Anoxybacillus caldiproteolyticus]
MTIFLLLGISGVAVYWQWHDYTQASKENNVPSLVHDIDIRGVANHLEITQTIKGLADESYDIILPDRAKHLSCTDEEGKACTITQRNQTSRINVDGRDQIEFRYVIPLPSSSKPLWLEHWSVQILSKQPQRFHVQLVDLTRKNGTWIAGAPLIGSLEREWFTLYVWAQKQVVSFPLYFEPLKVEKKEYGNVEVYARNNVSINDWNASKARNFAHVPSLTVVFSKFADKHISPTLMVVPETESLTLMEAPYLRSYYASYFLPNGAMNEWVADMLTSLAIGKQATTPQAKAILHHFDEQLTTKEKTAFFRLVLKQKGERVTSHMLDAALSKAYGERTTYFSDFVKRGESVPLLWTKEGTLYVNNVPLKQSNVVIQNEDILLPIVEVMRALGYRVERSGAEVFIEKQYNRWRFFVNSSLYMEGNDTFGTSSILVRDIRGTLYMSASIIQQWFPVYVEETARDVYVSGS